MDVMVKHFLTLDLIFLHRHENNKATDHTGQETFFSPLYSHYMEKFGDCVKDK